MGEEALVRAAHLGKRFGDRVAVRDLSLEIRRGEVFGLLGPNGAGKTTTVRMLAGLIAPTTGSAFIAGHDVARDGDAARARVGILTESPGLYVRLSAVENLRLFAGLHGLGEAETSKRIEKYLHLLGLGDRGHEPVGAFSKGMRQKLAIGRALLHEPPVLFLDEPTANLDPESAQIVREFVAELRHDGRATVICTHNLDEADRLCDRIGVVKQTLLRVGTPAELRDALYGRALLVRVRALSDAMMDAVRALPLGLVPARDGDRLRIPCDDPEARAPDIVRALVAAGADVLRVEPEAASLERVYLDLVQGGAA